MILFLEFQFNLYLKKCICIGNIMKIVIRSSDLLSELSVLTRFLMCWNVVARVFIVLAIWLQPVKKAKSCSCL